MHQPDVFVLPEGWLDLDETRQRLGRSQRTIQKLVKAKHLKVKRLPRSGARPPMPVYSSIDVERLAVEGKPKPIRPDTRTSAETRVAKRSEPNVLEAAMAGMLTQLAQLTAGREALGEAEKVKAEVEKARLAFEREKWEAERADRELREKEWLTPRECYRLKGIPTSVVRTSAAEGKLAAIACGTSWRIRRASLEAFAG